MGAAVVLSPVAIAHGNLSIQVGKDKKDSKSGGAVAKVGGSTVGELVESLNAFGVKPSDLVGILQALHTSGALKADLQFL
jgi:flagellar P-ring protein precursor FlgI